LDLFVHEVELLSVSASDELIIAVNWFVCNRAFHLF